MVGQTRDVRYLWMELLNGFQNRIAGDALVGRMYLHGESGIVDDAVNYQSRIGRSDEARLRSGPNKK